MGPGRGWRGQWRGRQGDGDDCDEDDLQAAIKASLKMADKAAAKAKAEEEEAGATTFAAPVKALPTVPRPRMLPPPSSLTPTQPYVSGNGPFTRLYQGLRSTMVPAGAGGRGASEGMGRGVSATDLWNRAEESR